MNILVVEDMEIIRIGIIQKLEDMPYEIKNIWGVANGLEGLNMIKEHEIDIVLTDIRMPIMNGLDFIQQAKKIKDEVEYIIITGYEDFEYAHRAIDMGVTGFALKPIDESFDQIFERAVTNLSKKRDIHVVKKEKKLLEDRTKTLELMQDVNHVLLDNQAPSLVLAKDAYYILVLVECMKVTQTEEIQGRINPILDTKEISYLWVHNFIREQEYFLILYGPDKGTLKKEAKEVTKRMRYMLSANKHLMIAISPVEKHLSSQLYEKAYQASLNRFFDHEGGIYSANHSQEEYRYDVMKDQIKAIQYAIELRDVEKIHQLLTAFFTIDNFKSMAEVPYVIMSFALMRDVVLNHFRIQVKDEDANLLFDRRKLFRSCYELEEIGDYFLAIITKYLEREQENREESTYYHNIKTYIDYHYSEPISLQSLSHEFGMNPSYLSTIFKKTTGVKLSQYLMNVRVKKACELLMQSNNAISDIAEAVGYEDAQYFYRVFKKVMGQTPLQYRKHLIKK